MVPFLWVRFNYVIQSHCEETVYFLPQVLRNSCYSFDESWKDKRLIQTWSHRFVSNLGPLDQESSTLTTRLLSAVLLEFPSDSNVFWQLSGGRQHLNLQTTVSCFAIISIRFKFFVVVALWQLAGRSGCVSSNTNSSQIEIHSNWD